MSNQSSSGNGGSGSGSNSSATPVTFSQVPGNSHFRGAGTNAVAIIPLLSSDKDGEIATTHSAKSFGQLMMALRRYANNNSNFSRGGGGRGGAAGGGSSSSSSSSLDDLLLVVPNSSLTRPGDWRYDSTPLKHFHWGHGCQRVLVFDGRPQFSRMAHDRLINHALTRDWIDLCPCRRTAAVIGVLNMRDCGNDLATLHRAEEELQLWAERYSTPPYEVTAHGRGFERDTVVERLFVFDSFDEECQQVDLTKAKLGSSILAFPPADQQHTQMMDLHLNVVVNDLAVAIFQQIEKRIKESDIIGRDSTLLSMKAAAEKRGRLVSRLMTSSDVPDEPTGGSNDLSLNNIKSVLSPDVQDASSNSGTSASSGAGGILGSVVGVGGGGGVDHRSVGDGRGVGRLSSGAGPGGVPLAAAAAMFSETANKAMSSIKVERKGAAQPQLLTPIDDVFEYSELSAKDADAMRKREAGRREKFAADLSLLAGSPMDAYERYLKAAEMCKSGSPDPLWYSSAMEGCAAAHIAMSEAGGYNVDEYLENNFQYPDEIMTLSIMKDRSEKARHHHHANSSHNKPFNKQTLPHVIARLGDEALNITGRHPQAASFHADLLLKLATYCCDGEDRDLMCRWGLGENCYGGDTGDPRRRWEKHSLNSQMFTELKTKDGEDLVMNSTIKRCKRFSELLHRAASTGALDPVTRVDVATRCVTMCMKGLKPTAWKKSISEQITFPRKAAFFTAVAAEAASVFSGGEGGRSNRRVSDLWLLASRLYAREGNTTDIRGDKTRYGWATIRASNLHALSLYERGVLSSEAAEQLLSLLSEITPDGVQDDNINLDGLFYSSSSNPASATMTASSSHGGAGVLDHSTGSSGGGGDVLFGDHQGLDTTSTATTIGTTIDHSLRSIVEESERSFAGGGGGGGRGGGDLDLDTLSSLTSRGLAKMKNSAIFSQMTASSSLLTVQGKWADDDPIVPLNVPLVDAVPDLCQHVLALSCLWSKVRIEKCALAQKKIINHIFALRRALPASSLKEMSYFSSTMTMSSSSNNSSNIHHYQQQQQNIDYHVPAAPPIYLASVTVTESEPSKILERIHLKNKKKSSSSQQSKDNNPAMETFFNPFAAKKKQRNEAAILVAEGEERFVSISFGNRLSVPLEIPSCQIEFSRNDKWRVLAPSLSFIIPSKSNNFNIHFPFKPISKQQEEEEEQQETQQEEEKGEEKKSGLDTFEMKGLKITCLGRAFFVPINESSMDNDDDENNDGNNNNSLLSKWSELPESGSVYPRLPPKNKKKNNGDNDDNNRANHKFEVVPFQPRLNISFCGSSIDDDKCVTVYLSDGEISTTSPFLLENHVSRNGALGGELERLQIVAVGLLSGGTGGSSSRISKRDEILFDSEKKEENEKDINDNKVSSSEKAKSDAANPAPVRVTALCSKLNIDEINKKHSNNINMNTNNFKKTSVGQNNNDTDNSSNNNNNSNAVSFRITAANEFGIAYSNKANKGPRNNNYDEYTRIRVKFRYRGKLPSIDSSEEIWRKREIVLRIVRVKGPRISSLTFRPDLTWGSAFSELCASLSNQNNLRKEKRQNVLSRRQSEPAIFGRGGGGYNNNASATPTRGAGLALAHHQSIKSINTTIGGAPSVNATNRRGGHNKNNNDVPSFELTRVGMDKGVHVCSNDVVVLLSIANETNVDILLSNENGLVCGFEGNSLPSVKVSSGVSVRIPVVLPRLKRQSDDKENDGGIPKSIVSQLVSKTTLHWEEIGNENHNNDDDNDDTTSNESLLSSSFRRRQGSMRIPPTCLKEIVARHPSFASRICEPPCSIRVNVQQKQQQQQQLVGDIEEEDSDNDKEKKKKILTISQGTALDVFAEMEMSEWIPRDFMEHCNITVEFCCARREEVVSVSNGIDSSFSSSSGINSPSKTSAASTTAPPFSLKKHDHEYVWCGQVRKCLRGGGGGGGFRGGKQVGKTKGVAEENNPKQQHKHDTYKHRARIVILQPGNFVVSACIKLEHDLAFNGAEEIWWAPVAEHVTVEKL